MNSNDELEQFLKVEPIDLKKTVPPLVGQGSPHQVLKREIGRVANLAFWLIISASTLFMLITAREIYLTKRVIETLQ